MRLLLKIWLICAIQTIGFAQTAAPSQRNTTTEAERARRAEAERRKRQQDTMQEEARKLNNTKLPQAVIPVSSLIKSKRSADQSQRLLPDSQDLEKYSSLLKSKKAGIFRIYPDFDCDSGNMVKIDDDCENSIPFTWSYSFQTKDYGDGNFFDFRFKNERLVADSFLTQNIMTSIGDIPLENITLEIRGMKFLLEFKPEASEKELREQFWQIANKISAEGGSYGKVITPIENTTYLMRVIAYRVSYSDIWEIEQNGPTSDLEKRLLFIAYDRNRHDKIIAFRVIRKNPDGSLTIVWNELAEKKSPTLKFGKPEELNGVANSKKQ